LFVITELSRFLREEAKMAFVAGPRQVGKTTFARRLLAEAGRGDLYFNWDIEAHRKLLMRHPGDFWQRGETSATKNHPRIVLDEIHKFPGWKRVLKGIGGICSI
jgi:hypothetical protein